MVASSEETREEELRRSEHHFEAVFHDPDAFIGLLDLDGTLRRANRTALEFLQISPEDVEGELFWETPWWTHSPELQADLQDWIERAATGEYVGFEAEHYSLDGHRVTVGGTIRPVRNDQGEVVSLIAEGRDITTREERKRELERQNDRLDQFTSIVSHDLRNPLNVASGRLEFVRDDCDSEHLDDVERAFDRMEALIENLLTLARKGQVIEEVTTVELTGLVRRCWSNVETDHAELRVRASGTIEADETRVKELFENLFRNSVEHGSTSSRPAADDAVEHGGTKTTITVGALSGGDGFYVEDDGPGIPEDEREKVFDPGYTTRTEGTGFGLNIVQEIARAHGWEIRVTEGDEGGARFDVSGVKVR